MPIILAQTDTTVGFLSQNEKKLFEIKSREQTKPFLKVFNSFNSLKEHTIRVPQKFKKKVRRAKKTTFIVKNQAFRVTHLELNSQILRKYSWQYSTSANESGKNFDREFCELKADIIIEDKNSLKENSPSSLLKINAKKIKKLR